MQFISIAFLFFAMEALAINLQYSCRYTEGGVGRTGANESAAGGKIDDKQAQEIVSHMGAWSNNKFEATRKTNKNAESDTIIVKCKNHVKTKQEALDKVKEQQKLVKGRRARRQWRRTHLGTNY